MTKKVFSPQARVYGVRRTVFFGEASSKSRVRSDDSYTLQSVIWSRPHGISIILVRKNKAQGHSERGKQETW